MRLRKASWLALLSLAWLQVSLASHQFDHVAAYPADTCHVCVQLDRIDDVVVDQADSHAVPFGRYAEPRRSPAVVVATALVRHFESRAPPAL
jgi:hypothetical protein